MSSVEIENNMGEEKLPAILKDPFKKNCVKRIYVNYSEAWSGKEWKANGVVEFSNGNTKGEQSFSGESFDEVVAKIKIFITEELK
jgi:hypothetical protein